MSIQTPTMSSHGGDTPPLVSVSNDRTPLLSSHSRLFRSLSGVGGRPDDAGSTRRLTTFSGVFTPVCLSMFSALLFLRVGFIVGQSGFLEVLLQFALAYMILICTVLSISAISTNGAVEGGGVYYMISRTLGPEFGGSIGTLFFFANIFSSALYITGCVEGLIDNFGTGGNFIKYDEAALPSGRWWNFLYGSVVGIFNLIVCLIGASMFARTSLLIFVVVMICTASVIISIFAQNHVIQVDIPDSNSLINHTEFPTANYTGMSWKTFQENVWSHYGPDYTNNGKMVDFATVFGVLFSGVTGIMAGANMSGDLKEPGQSIPKGTVTAVGFTGVVYVILSFLTALSCSNFLLTNNYIFMQNINLWPPFVVIGLFAATLSASLSNLIGASRILEAVAKDNLFGIILRPIAQGVFRGNPVFAVIVSWFMVQIILLIGSLNQIAQITSVLFLLSYCATNIACLALELASAPNFRPTFKYFSWYTCILGLVGTLSMMFVINAIYAACCIIACLLLIIALHLRSPESNWGSISQALIFHQVRKYLLLLDSRKDHVKFWRPQMLLLISNPRTCCPLIEFANDLKKSGLFVLGHVKLGTVSCEDPRDPVQEEYPYWLSLVDQLKVKAFVELTLSASVREGIHHLIRLSGLGAMKPNTILIGFYDRSNQGDVLITSNSPFHVSSPSVEVGELQTFPQNRNAKEPSTNFSSAEYVKVIQDIIWLQKNLCICRHFQRLDRKSVLTNTQTQFIDVWAVNFFNPTKHCMFDTTTLFLLQLACILHMVSGWKKRTDLRVLLCISNAEQDSFSAVQSQLESLLKVLRIEALISVVIWDDVLSLYTSNVKDESDVNDIAVLNVQYIEGVNDLIKRNSMQTAVSFLYLSPPPKDQSLHSTYLQYLDSLTSHLPPTVMVHGISPVTTTTL